MRDAGYCKKELIEALWEQKNRYNSSQCNTREWTKYLTKETQTFTTKYAMTFFLKIRKVPRHSGIEQAINSFKFP